MNNPIRILLIVEGPVEEQRFFKLMSDAFGASFEIVVYGTNIYDLYSRLMHSRQTFGGNYLNIKDVVLEKVQNESARKQLSEDFAFTYLIYDCDIHHRDWKESVKPTMCERINKNVPVLKSMLEQFVDESDGTIGKLYINYPMMEAWRDADAFFDDTYKDRFIDITQSPDYKAIVSTRRLAGMLSKPIGKEQLSDIIRMMVFKLAFIMTGEWKPLDYEDYLRVSSGACVLEEQAKLMNDRGQIGVLNTSAFLIVDYFGNRSGLYDQIVKGE